MYQALELLAVLTSGIYGILQARSTRMDFLGVFTVSFATAFGGGTLRDLMLDRKPLFWIESSHYPVILFGMTLASFFLPRLPKDLKKYLNLPDAIGLGLFSIVGAQYALEADTSWFIAALFGVITGTFGGVVSDVLCNQVPTIFRSAPLYATCSFVGCWCFILLEQLPLLEFVAPLLGFAIVVSCRLAALYWNIQLPELKDNEPSGR